MYGFGDSQWPKISLEHVTAGRSDREIATLLYVSVRTVQKHLQHAYEKLGVHTRTAAAMLIVACQAELDRSAERHPSLRSMEVELARFG